MEEVARLFLYIIYPEYIIYYILNITHTSGL
jgi:hypothetical protein